MEGTRPPRDFDRLREALQHQFERLSPNLQRIAQYALGDPNRFALQTVAETARETGVQPSALIRSAYVVPTMKLLVLGHLPMVLVVTFFPDLSLWLPRLVLGIQ